MNPPAPPQPAPRSGRKILVVVLGLIAAAITSVAIPWLDDDPATSPDVRGVIEAVAQPGSGQ